MEEENKIINKINELYITYRGHYLCMNKDGKYSRITYNKESGIPKLNDSLIRQHIRGNKTYGIFSGKELSKFIIFDIDIPKSNIARWCVYKIRKVLGEMGFDREKIYAVWSGTKGYHVILHFEKPVELYKLKIIFNEVIKQGQLDQFELGKVEFRATHEQGVKLPLGRNFKNKDSDNNICYFCDIDNGIKIIKDKSYILNVKQISIEEMQKVLLSIDNQESQFIEINNKYEEFKNEIKELYKPLPIYQQNINERVTLEAIMNLINNGLSVPASRHNSLMKIGKFYKSYHGLDESECKQVLTEWMSWQDKSMYSTSWNDCLKDIDEIVEYIYKNNIRLVIDGEGIDVIITKQEMDCIMRIKKKSQKILIFAMLIHSKRYQTGKGIFYMTYSQIGYCLGMTEYGAFKLVNKFANDNEGVLEFIERNQKVLNNKGKVIGGRPNKYRLHLDKLKVNNTYKENDFIKDNVTELKKYKELYYKAVCKFYTNDELKLLCNKEQRYEFQEYRLKLAHNS